VNARTLRSWILLLAFAGVLTAGLRPSVLSDVAAGLLCIGCAVALMALDGQRKRRRR
jgi:hypothetical protein